MEPRIPSPGVLQTCFGVQQACFRDAVGLILNAVGAPHQVGGDSIPSQIISILLNQEVRFVQERWVGATGSTFAPNIFSEHRDEKRRKYSVL